MNMPGSVVLAAGFAALLSLGEPLGATDFDPDDPQQQQQFYDDVVDLLNNDAASAMQEVYDYLELFVWIGYSDGRLDDPAKQPEGVFGDAYLNYFARMAERLNKRLGQCDPTVVRACSKSRFGSGGFSLRGDGPGGCTQV